VGQVLPGASDPFHFCLAAQLALRPDLAGHAGHFRSEGAELIHHRVDGVLELEDLTADIHCDGLGEVAAGEGRRDHGDVADLRREVAGHRVDTVGEVLPRTRYALYLRLAAQLAFRTDLASNTGHLGGERPQLVHHRVDDVLDLEDFSLDVHGDFLGQV